MPSYTFLLVLALAASTVTPVLSAEAAEPLGRNEERALVHLERRDLTSKLNRAAKGLIFTTAVASVVTVLAGSLYFALRPEKQTADTTNTTESTNATQPTSTNQTNTPRAISRRKGRPFGRGLPVDISGQKRASPRLNLKSRADLGGLSGSLELD